MIDDYSRAICGYMVFTGAPSALNTALALRQAIWRKTDPVWAVCGLPDVLHVDHGSDFTSHHLEYTAVALKIRLIFSTIGRPQGRGKVERFYRQRANKSTLGQTLLRHPEGPDPLLRWGLPKCACESPTTS